MNLYLVGTDLNRPIGKQVIAIPAGNKYDKHTFIAQDDGIVEGETPLQARQNYILRMTRSMMMRRVQTL